MGQGWISNRPQETELGERIVLRQSGMTAKDHTGGLQVHCKLVGLTVAKNSLGFDMAVDSKLRQVCHVESQLCEPRGFHPDVLRGLLMCCRSIDA